uniref:Probable acetate kinase n=1 Tax=Tetraselmis sp. GSL018 TaxID=582737 RepID=A0A061RM02_9CHLO
MPSPTNWRPSTAFVAMASMELVSYACKQAAQQLGRQLHDLNMIVCHLGSGASMACIKGGKCIDTTMGMTPLEGLVMSTRSGDIDAGVILHLAQEEGMDLSQFSDLLNKKSGLKGMCGNADMRSIALAIESGDENAMIARAVFIRRVRKYLGSYMVQLGGKLDALVFTGGIGENDVYVRREV